MSVGLFLLTFGLVARATRLITEDYITRGIRIWFLKRFGPKHDLSYLVRCPWCLGLWLAAAIVPVAWYYGHTDAFQIVAIVATISWLVGIVASWLDGSKFVDTGADS